MGWRGGNRAPARAQRQQAQREDKRRTSKRHGAKRVIGAGARRKPGDLFPRQADAIEPPMLHGLECTTVTRPLPRLCICASRGSRR